VRNDRTIQADPLDPVYPKRNVMVARSARLKVRLSRKSRMFDQFKGNIRLTGDTYKAAKQGIHILEEGTQLEEGALDLGRWRDSCKFSYCEVFSSMVLRGGSGDRRGHSSVMGLAEKTDRAPS
jgi:hypothetical protein